MIKLQMHKITVILPTYNGATRGNGKYLREAIESVLGQTYKNFELIIINDGSTDNTEDIIKEYNDERIIYLKHNENKGPSAARNTGLMKAVGEYIAFLDDDDFYYENKLEEQLNDLVGKGMFVSLCDGYIINEQNMIVGAYINKEGKNHVKEIYTCKIHTFSTSIMFYKNIVEHIGLFKEYLYGFVDWDYLIRVAVKYEISFLHKKLYYYRKHHNNLSSNNEKMYIYGLIIKNQLEKNILPFYENRDLNRYNADFFLMWMQWKYDENNFLFFRKYFKIALLFTRLSIKWYFRYMLSYFPYILYIYRNIKKCIKSQ